MYEPFTDYANTPLQDLTEQVAACMRRHGIKRATGSDAAYALALHFAMMEIKTTLREELKIRVREWVLPRSLHG